MGRKQMSERREVRQKAKQRRKWEQNFVRQSAQDDRNLNKAVEATEADERTKKNVEAEMELAKGDMKERKQKLLITAKRKERYEAMAKQKGTTAEMIEAEERETEAMKEVTEKQQMTARGSAKTEADIKAKQLEEKEEELQKEDSADSAEAASDQAAAESAAEEEAKEQADEQEASNAAAAKASEEKVSALEQAVAKAEVKKVEAEQTARAEKAQAKEEAAKEKEQKTALACEQVAAEQRSKKCLSEENASLKKEICEKADEDEVQKRADQEQEKEGVEEELSEEKDSHDASADVQAQNEKVRELKKKELASKHQARKQQIKQEAAEKRKINKENWEKKKSFTKRQNLLKNDKQEDQATQMVEIKSKQQQIADLKVSLGHQQKIAQQDRVNERTTKKFNRVLRENGVKTEQKALAAQQAAAKS